MRTTGAIDLPQWTLDLVNELRLTEHPRLPPLALKISGTIDAPLGRDVRSRVRMAVTHRGKPARTSFRVVERFGEAALLECRLETVRTH